MVDIQPEYIVAGRYLCSRQLADGGTGTIWLAQSDDRDVVIKVLTVPASPLARQERKGYFDDEVECGQALKDIPHIRQLIDHGHDANARNFGSPEGIWYLVFEYVPFGTLRDLLESRSPATLRALELKEIARSISVGLMSAHEHPRRFRHRDIKPENVLVPDADCSRALVADFGIARAEDGTRITTRSPGGSVGTTRYMAPEQFDDSASVDCTADQYSTALVLWECATGLVPDAELSPTKVRDARSSGATLPVFMTEGRVAPLVEKTLARALAPSPVDRYPSMRKFYGEFEAAGMLDGLWHSSTQGSLVSRFAARGIEVVDMRPKGGALWVLGGRELEHLMRVLEEEGCRFSFLPQGGKATSGSSAWWTGAKW